LSGSIYVPRILVVEDDVMVRNAIVAILTHEKYEVLEANSAEALQVSSNFEGIIDVLIADSSLMTTAGRPLTAELVEARPGLRVLQFDSRVRENFADEVKQILKPLGRRSASMG
jgi:DNA-binding response OmpR family regulator